MATFSPWQSSVDSVISNINQINFGARTQADDTLLGGMLSSQGSKLAAKSYRQASSLVGQATAFNLDVQSTNTLRQLQDLTRSYQLLASKQIAGMAASGLSLNSKSFLQLQSEAVQTTTTKLMQAKMDAENQRRATLFSSYIQQTNLENQARAADYQAQVDIILAQRRAVNTLNGASMQTAALRNSLNQTTGSLFTGR